MPRRNAMLAIVVAVGLLAGCLGDDDDELSTPTTSAAAESAVPRELRVVGRENRFDVESLTAPAGVGFSIVFDNRDARITHNVAVYRSGPPAKDLVAKTDVEAGPTTQRLKVPALDPGRYFYQCDLHPTTMTGTLMVISSR